MKPWMWSVAGLVAGACGIVLAFVPGGPVGAVLGALGIVAAVVALHRHAHRVGAGLALVASGIAIALVVVMALVPHRASSCDGTALAKQRFGDNFNGFYNPNTDEVLAKLMSAEFGAVSTYAEDPGVLLTLTNKLPIAMEFAFTVTASDAHGTRIADEQRVAELLGPDTVQPQRVFTRDAARLAGATFALTDVRAGPLSPVRCGPASQ